MRLNRLFAIKSAPLKIHKLVVTKPNLKDSVCNSTGSDTILRGALLTWREGWYKYYQKLVNRYGRAITGMLQSTPTVVVNQEVALRPTISLQNNRQ